VSTTVPTPVGPQPGVPGPARNRRMRNAAVVAGAAAVITAGGFGVIAIFGSDAQPPQPVPAQRSAPPTVARDTAIEEMRETIAALYGPRPGGVAIAPTARDTAIAEMRATISKLYGPRSTATAPTARDTAIKEMRETIAALYGDGQPATRTSTGEK
jgi:hypothetical protein